MQGAYRCVETAARFAILVVSSKEASSSRTTKRLAYYNSTRLPHPFTMTAKLG